MFNGFVTMVTVCMVIIESSPLIEFISVIVTDDWNTSILIVWKEMSSTLEIHRSWLVRVMKEPGLVKLVTRSYTGQKKIS